VELGLVLWEADEGVRPMVALRELIFDIIQAQDSQPLRPEFLLFVLGETAGFAGWFEISVSA
jgi:hypothetical protein